MLDSRAEVDLGGEGSEHVTAEGGWLDDPREALAVELAVAHAVHTHVLDPREVEAAAVVERLGHQGEGGVDLLASQELLERLLELLRRRPAVPRRGGEGLDDDALELRWEVEPRYALARRDRRNDHARSQLV